MSTMGPPATLISLSWLSRFDDFAILALRLATGIFLIEGVWDNISDPARMAEFEGFMTASGFTNAGLWAPFSVYTQFLAGILMIPGLLTRWAGSIVFVTFVVGIWFVHFEQTLREWWPALALVVIGLTLMTRGGGRYALDRLMPASWQ